AGDGSHQPVVDAPLIAIAHDIEVRIAQQKAALHHAGDGVALYRRQEVHRDLAGRPVGDLPRSGDHLERRVDDEVVVDRHLIVPGTQHVQVEIEIEGQKGELEQNVVAI